jgi:hypothetical protein
MKPDAAALPIAGPYVSTHWSGGIVFAPPQDAIRWVEGAWRCPAAQLPGDHLFFANDTQGVTLPPISATEAHCKLLTAQSGSSKR